MFFGATTFAGDSFGAQGGASATIALTGIQVTATEGALIFLGDVTTFPTGIDITSTLASVILPNVDVQLTGIQINSTFNGAGVTVIPENVVSVSGQNIAFTLNNPGVGVIAWESVDDSASMTWAPVSDTASFSWSSVDDSASMTWTEVSDTEAA